jgi:spermidine synthase
MIALGGSLGGIFNALIAPLAFDSILEYPLLIALACYIRIDAKNNKDNKKKNSIFTSVLVPLLFGLWMIILIKILGYSDSFDIPSLLLRDILPLFLLYYLSSSTRIFAGSILVILVLANFYPSAHGEIIHASRTFFGVHRVTISPNKKFIQLIHGKTVHGLQNIANESKNLPTSYYHPSGPVGQVFTAMRKNKKQIKEVALIGLGVGSIAAFAKPGERFTFFEIDRAVIKIATNKQLFTFLSNSKAETRIIQGDGRVSIEQEPDKTYDILILDAFSSDSVPVHLLTTEAFNLYLNKLRPDGIMLLHVSSRYFSMQNVIAATLSATKSNLKIFYQEDEDINDEQRNEGKSVSAWMVAAQNQNVAGITEILTKDRKWQQLKPDNHNKCIWTDERSSIFDVLFPELYR